MTIITLYTFSTFSPCSFSSYCATRFILYLFIYPSLFKSISIYITTSTSIKRYSIYFKFHSKGKFPYLLPVRGKLCLRKGHRENNESTSKKNPANTSSRGEGVTQRGLPVQPAARHCGILAAAVASPCLHLSPSPAAWRFPSSSARSLHQRSQRRRKQAAEILPQ